MRYQLLSTSPNRVFAVVFDAGDEVLAGLSEVVERESLDAADLTAVGGFERAIVGWFDVEKRDYVRIPIDEQVEVLSLIGDVTYKGEATSSNGDRGHKIHCHAVLGRRDGSTVGGHVIQGMVRPTLEVMLTETPASLRRRHDQATGLALIDLRPDGADSRDARTVAGTARERQAPR